MALGDGAIAGAEAGDPDCPDGVVGRAAGGAGNAGLGEGDVSGEGPSEGLLFIPRVGYTGRRWQFVAGVALQYSAAAQPRIQWLPSLHGAYDFGSFGLEAGLFEEHGLALAQLSVVLGDFSVGYVAPFGALFHARLRVMKNLGVRVGAMAFRLANAEVGMVTVAVVAGPGAGVAP